ncbi:MAG: hypothetical protein AAFQ43_13485 [Bacteroidota bacterium]
MRALVLFALLPFAGGCLFPTPLITPEPLAQGETHVDAAAGATAFVFAPTVGANVRHGLGDGREVQVRAQAFAEVASGGRQGVGGVVGGGITQRLWRGPENTTAAVSLNLGGSVALAPPRTGSPEDGRTPLAHGYATLIGGSDHLYGGLRVAAGSFEDYGWETSGDDLAFRLMAGPFVGARIGTGPFLGVEIASYVGPNGAFVSPALTFGRKPTRAGTIPAPEAVAPPEASGGK